MRRTPASRSRASSTRRTRSRSSSGARTAFASSTSSTSRPSRSPEPAAQRRPVGRAMTIHIAGAGMAGLCAAARARELGVDVVVYEKGTRTGGSMLLSSCVVWRYLDLESFRAECPGGDAGLQRAVIDRLDAGLAWLRSLGAPVVWEETGNPRTVGLRFEPRGLTEALVRAAGVEV